MNCPVCETRLEAKFCPVCETAFSQADYDKLRHFSYLLRVTEDWTPSNLAERRQRYVDAYAHYREQAFAKTRKEWKTGQSAETDTAPADVAEPPPPTDSLPPADDPTFEQWLFSENTIKSALYSGAFLLILAGLIFVGANWSRLPGIGKLGVTLTTTALMCGAGFGLLLRSKTLRIGGLALIGIAAGFAPLNFYVVDEYLFNLDDATIWVIGSLICTLFYLWLVRQTKSSLLGTFMAAGIVSTQIGLYALLNAEDVLMATLVMLLPVPLVWIGLRWREVAYIFRPNYTLAHLLAAPIYFGVSVATLTTDTLYTGEWIASHWWLVAAVLVGCAFYIANFRAIQSQLSELLAAAAFSAATITLTTHLVNLYIVNREGGSGDGSALGIAFTVMMAIYLAAGFAQPRYRWWLHGTGVLLSLLAFGWTWETPLVATIVLVVIAIAYTLAALRYRVAWLILPSLTALYLAVWAFWQIGSAEIETPLIVSYATLGVLLLGTGRWLRWRHQLSAVLLLAAGGSTLLLAFAAAVSAENQWLAVILSIVVATTAIALTWLEQDWLLNETEGSESKPFAAPGFLTIIAALAIFVGHFNLMEVISQNQDGAWPLITITLCAAYVAASWFLQGARQHQLFGLPLNGTGFAMMLVPLAFAFEFDWWVVATVCAVIGAMAIADGRRRHGSEARYYQQLVGVGFLIGALWAMLAQYNVEEAQWYALPLGLTLLVLGWTERQRERSSTYLLFTVVGLLVLFGSALSQSFDEVRYAFLLLIETIVAIIFGIHNRSRAYVQVSGLALIVNGLVQFGPAFANLPRFVQIGLVGSTLLLLGLLALFRREELIKRRNSLRDEWRGWDA